MIFKLNSIAAALLAASLSAPAFAEEAVKPPTPIQGGMSGMGGMMGGMSDEMREQHLKQKQENFLKMVDLSNKILAATDPKEKDRLKAEQLQIMKDYEKAHHEMMQQHMQQMMKGGGMGGMGGMNHGGGAPGQGGMGGMQHGTQPAPATAPAH